jgi:hypothetical protein
MCVDLGCANPTIYVLNATSLLFFFLHCIHMQPSSRTFWLMAKPVNLQICMHAMKTHACVQVWVASSIYLLGEQVNHWNLLNGEKLTLHAKEAMLPAKAQAKEDKIHCILSRQQIFMLHGASWRAVRSGLAGCRGRAVIVITSFISFFSATYLELKGSWDLCCLAFPKEKSSQLSLVWVTHHRDTSDAQQEEIFQCRV